MLLDNIKTRRSIVNFSARPVEEEKLSAVFEAAGLAPSSFNAQPWRFVYATQQEPDEFRLLFDCLFEGNQKWVKNVPVLILTIAETILSYNSQPNKYAKHDTALATAFLIIQAQSLGLNTHVMGGFDGEKAKKNLFIPPPFEPVAMIALGYHNESTDSLPAEILKRETNPRVRVPLENIVFKGRLHKK